MSEKHLDFLAAALSGPPPAEALALRNQLAILEALHVLVHHVHNPGLRHDVREYNRRQLEERMRETAAALGGR